jgi:stage V sporulation protein G
MTITEVRVSLRHEGKLRAYATITIDDCFVIRRLKIIEGGRGHFIAFPSRRRPDGHYQDLCHPINNETRWQIEETVLQAYSAVLERRAMVQ